MAAPMFIALRSFVSFLPFALLAVARAGTIQDIEHGTFLFFVESLICISRSGTLHAGESSL